MNDRECQACADTKCFQLYSYQTYYNNNFQTYYTLVNVLHNMKICQHKYNCEGGYTLQEVEALERWRLMPYFPSHAGRMSSSSDITALCYQLWMKMLCEQISCKASNASEDEDNVTCYKMGLMALTGNRCSVSHTVFTQTHSCFMEQDNLTKKHMASLCE